jgi:phosphatidylserine decarboxylase
MSQVSSVVLKTSDGVELPKGAEIGYFQFGGSDIILLFQRGTDLEVDTGSQFRHVGSAAAHVKRS